MQLIGPGRTISELFALQLGRRVTQPAVMTPEKVVSYGELDERARALAAAMLERRGDRSELVAILTDDDIEGTVAMLATLQAGRFFVRLDGTATPDQLRMHIDLLQPLMMVHDAPMAAAAAELGADATRLDTHERGSWRGGQPSRQPHDLSHLLLTSGSTSRPKAVMQEHRTFLRTVRDNVRALELRDDDRFAIAVPLIFGHGLAMLFSTLLVGATLQPFDVQRRGVAGLGRWLASAQSTVVSATPSLLRTFMHDEPTQRFERVRALRLSGEATHRGDVAALQRRFPRARIVTTLGASEAGLVCHHVLEPGQLPIEPLVPVGWPEEGVEVDIDDNGEMLIRHDALSPGYWNDPAATAARFVPDPQDPTRRLYRSRDLGRRRADGCLLHLGRIDDVVRIRGISVARTEVQAALRALDGVVDAAVVSTTDKHGGTQLVGFVVSRSAHREATWHARLRDSVPPAAVPAALVRVETLPRLAGGKLDLPALQQQAAAVLQSGQHRQQLLQYQIYTPPRDPLEAQLVAIWEALLEVRPLGVDQDFFSLGGHSLLASRMLGAVEKACGVRLPLAVLRSDATIAALAQRLVEKHTPTEPITMLYENTAGRAPLFFFHGDLNGGGFYSRGLLRDLDRTCYLVNPHGVDGAPLPATLEAMAAERAAQIERLAPGPVHLAGYCNGGYLAYETARLLRQRGHAVGSVIVIEAAAARRRGWLGRLAVATLRLAFAVIRRDWHLSAQRGLFWKSLAIRLQRWTPLARLRGWLTGQWERHENPAFQRYAAICRRYTPQRYDGRVVLLATTDLRAQSVFDRSAGWSAVAPQLEVHRVPGNHISMLSTHVDVLGTRLRQALAD
jgi:acyl-coenzyme A synthetase/AMP-(fatty) acid ligase/thioesterase domain-containing protein